MFILLSTIFKWNKKLYILIRNTILEKPKDLNKSYFNTNIYADSNRLILHMSTTPVLEIKVGESIYFFRECSRHTSKKKYVKDFIDFYFNHLYDNKELAMVDKEFIYKNLNKRKNFSKFFNMEKKVLEFGGVPPYYNFSDLISDFDEIGIDEEYDDGFAKRLSTFFRYSISKLSDYKLNEFGLFNNKWNSWSSCRNFAYLEILKLFGMEKYSPNIKYCNLYLKGDRIFGSIMDRAIGIPAYLFSKDEKKRILPNFQRELLILNAIDYICLIRDHSIYNYNIVIDENGNAMDVIAFDNNEAGSFSADECLYFQGYHGESPLVDKDGHINRPYFDAGFAEKIVNLNKKEVFIHLKKYLTRRQIYRLWQRISFLKTAIKKTVEMRPKFLINEEQWSYETIEEECSGKYGKTYLYSIMK